MSPGTNEVKRYVPILGPVIWFTSLSLQALLLALVLFGPKPSAEAHLFPHASLGSRPERDGAIYALGVVVMLLLGLFALPRLVAANSRRPSARSVLGYSLSLAIFGGAGLLLFLATWSNRAPFTDLEGKRVAGFGGPVPLFVPLVLTLCAGVAVAISDHWARRLELSSTKGAHWADVLIAAGIFGLLFLTPTGVHWLAGQYYLSDRFHHWDYFAMGPALSFRSGMALGTSAYSQYGVGWPLLYVFISPVLPLSYGNMIWLASVFVALYFAGLYILLRALLKDIPWALLGTLGAISAIMYTYGQDKITILCTPSSTPLRSPTDLWFFASLLLYLRSRNKWWMASLGAACGLGLAFETDTGLYLLATFFFFQILLSLGKSSTWRSRGKERLQSAALFLVACTFTFFPPLVIAARGTIFQPAFWNGWLECMRTFSQLGLSNIPIASVDDSTLLTFAALIGMYLVTLLLVTVVQVRGESSPNYIFVAAVAWYGTLSLMLFVNRSHPINLFHPLVPAAIVLGSWGYQIEKLCRPSLRSRLFPVFGIAGVLLMLCTNRDFQQQPHWFSTKYKPEITGIYLLENPDDVMLPRSSAGEMLQFKAFLRELHEFGQTHEIAVLAADDVLIIKGAGLKPWYRYLPLMASISTTEDFDLMAQAFRAYRPDAVLLSRSPRWADEAPLFKQMIQADYVKSQDKLGYELWVKR